MSDTDAERDVIEAAEAVAAAQAVAATRLAYLRRRLQVALIDLDLDQLLGATWCQIGDEGFEFRPLDARTSDRLVNLLESIAERLPARPAPQPGYGQGMFDL